MLLPTSLRLPPPRRFCRRCCRRPPLLLPLPQLCRAAPPLLLNLLSHLPLPHQVRAIAMDVGNAVDESSYVPVICGLSRTRDKVRGPVAWFWCGKV